MKRTSTLRQRTPLRRKARLRARSRTNSYRRRPRDLDFMSFVGGQLCSVEVERPDPDRTPSVCTGKVEADHAGRRGIGQKAADDTCIPLCTKHHRERTDHYGSFKHLTRDQVRAWLLRQIARTQTTYQEARTS